MSFSDSLYSLYDSSRIFTSPRSLTSEFKLIIDSTRVDPHLGSPTIKMENG